MLRPYAMVLCSSSSYHMLPPTRPNASSGHYVAHIKGINDDRWKECNDGVVQDIPSKNTATSAASGASPSTNTNSVDSAVDNDTMPTKPKPKTKSKGKGKGSARALLPGWHACRDVYMLVYRAKRSVDELKKKTDTAHGVDSDAEWPWQGIQSANEAYIEGQHQKAEKNRQQNAKRVDTARQITQHIEALSLGVETSMADTEWICSSWLQSWLKVVSAGCTFWCALSTAVRQGWHCCRRNEEVKEAGGGGARRLAIVGVRNTDVVCLSLLLVGSCRRRQR